MNDEIFTTASESEFPTDKDEILKAMARAAEAFGFHESMAGSLAPAPVKCRCPAGYVELTTRHDSKERQAAWPFDEVEALLSKLNLILACFRWCRACGESAIITYDLSRLRLPRLGISPEKP